MSTRECPHGSVPRYFNNYLNLSPSLHRVKTRFSPTFIFRKSTKKLPRDINLYFSGAMEFNGIIALRVYKLLFWLNNTLQFGLKLPRTQQNKTTFSGKAYMKMEEVISRGRDKAAAGTHSRISSVTYFLVVRKTYQICRQHRPEPMLDKNAPFLHQATVNRNGEIW